MCGRFNVQENQLMRGLMKSLRVDELPMPRLNVAPGATGQFVIEHDGQRQMVEGYWSLLIEPRPEGKSGYRPNPKFKTFNARSDRLEASPLWRARYYHKRAILPISGFHEWVGKQCFQIEQAEQATALAALYDFSRFGEELVPSFTIITLPGHPRLAHIHDKSLPLMLEPEDFDTWLDPSYTAVDGFWSLMKPTLHHPLRITPIASPATLDIVQGYPAEMIDADRSSP